MFLDSHDNLAVHKSVQYVQDRMKIEGGGPGGGGVAYPPVMEKICMVWFLNKENQNLIQLINQKNQFLNLVCLIIMYNSQAAIILTK